MGSMDHESLLSFPRAKASHLLTWVPAWNPQMPSNKDRLYVLLYSRNGPPTVPEGEDRYPSTPMQTSLQMQFLTPFRYHLALMTEPKGESDGNFGVRHHAKDRIVALGSSEWRYDECRVTLKATSMLLVRVPAGEFTEMGRLVDIFRDVPVVPNSQS